MEQKIRNTFFSHELKSGLVTILLLLAVVALSSFVTWQLFNLTERRCYEDLASITNDAIEALDTNIRSERMTLRVLAGLIAEEGTLESISVSRFLTVYDVNSEVASAGILLPDNSCLTSSGRDPNVSDIMTFSKELEAGEHISGLQQSVRTRSLPVIRSFEPVRHRGMTLGVLYSELNPSKIAELWLPAAYNGKASIYVVDRRDGSILVNTARDGLENISGLDIRELKSGFTGDELRNGILAGKRAYTAFMLPGDTEYRYACYMPLDSADWELMVVVPGEYVFAPLLQSESHMFTLLGVEALLFILYFFWLLYQTRKSIRETERIANVDILTGLPNRNRYEAFLQEPGVPVSSLVCIYTDVNGLHEINNAKGHEAGDIMLQFIAGKLQEHLSPGSFFRIGGDEFVTFMENRELSGIQEAVSLMEKDLEKEGYHAAVGLCAGSDEMSMNELTKGAEMEMYEAKRRYYASGARDRRSRTTEDETH